MSKLFAKRPQPTVLVVLDGWGVAQPNQGNAVTEADTPFFDELITKYPTMLLQAAGQAVGLPDGVMGNSEVGHLTLGAGRICDQDLQKINKAIANKSFATNPIFKQAQAHVQEQNSQLHLVGLVSDGRVHSSLEHLKALLDWAAQAKINPFIHCILDGRDTLRDEGLKFVTELQDHCRQVGVGRIATMSGRFYAMDRDNHWERTGQAYWAMVKGEGRIATDAVTAIKQAYTEANFDEEFLPTVLQDNGQPLTTIKDNDAIIFFNYRADRARQLTKAFVLEEMTKFERGPKLNDLFFAGFTEYELGLPMAVAFPKENIGNTLGQILSEHNLKQLRLAETEKYAHVTYFFNGGQEATYPGEEHILVPSPRIDSYASQPEMSANEIANKAVQAIEEGVYNFILVNFANPDMVGHTGDMTATIKAVETVDKCLSRIVKAVLAKKGLALITADHGNAEETVDLKTNNLMKEHSSNPVPLILVSPQLEGQNLGKTDIPGNDLSVLQPSGGLSDVAPTILKIMGLSQPSAMTGKSLI
ncbi:MAG: 2,3-bisphosphoglycerate-independent phosphoglycerate mutase [bacterium]